VLEVANLATEFATREGALRAVNGVSFALATIEHNGKPTACVERDGKFYLSDKPWTLGVVTWKP